LFSAASSDFFTREKLNFVLRRKLILLVDFRRQKVTFRGWRDVAAHDNPGTPCLKGCRAGTPANGAWGRPATVSHRFHGGLRYFALTGSRSPLRARYVKNTGWDGWSRRTHTSAAADIFMPKKRRDGHGFFRLDNTRAGLPGV